MSDKIESDKTDKRDPFLNHNFTVSLLSDDKKLGGFLEVTGIEMEIEMYEHKEGGNDFVHYLPNGVKQSNLVLKKGLTNSEFLWEWYRDSVMALMYHIPFKSIRKDIKVTILDRERSYVFKDAYPIKWTGPQLKSTDNSIAIESIEFVHKGFIDVF